MGLGLTLLRFSPVGFKREKRRCWGWGSGCAGSCFFGCRFRRFLMAMEYNYSRRESRKREEMEGEFAFGIFLVGGAAASLRELCCARCPPGMETGGLGLASPVGSRLVV
ncbi:hypothetical protein NL676_017593 [Syzygium grande]|nr:hypothetical protein NL676_017593 [Syzygium grande]